MSYDLDIVLVQVKVIAPVWCLVGSDRYGVFIRSEDQELALDLLAQFGKITAGVEVLCLCVCIVLLVLIGSFADSLFILH